MFFFFAVAFLWYLWLHLQRSRRAFPEPSHNNSHCARASLVERLVCQRWENEPGRCGSSSLSHPPLHSGFIFDHGHCCFEQVDSFKEAVGSHFSLNEVAWMKVLVLHSLCMSWHLGEQHADGGPGPSCVWLSDEAGPTGCSDERRGGEKEYIVYFFFCCFHFIFSVSSCFIEHIYSISYKGTYSYVYASVPAITPQGNFFKFATNIHLDSRMKWLELDGQRSEVTVTSQNTFMAITQECVRYVWPFFLLIWTLRYLYESTLFTSSPWVSTRAGGLLFLWWSTTGSLVLLILSFRWLSLYHVTKLSISPLYSSVKIVSKWRQHVSHWKLFTGITRQYSDNFHFAKKYT